ncbi:MAG: capsular polysaccharide synthesis protein [Bacillota bacterium]|nr:capsular polysaccharide synthesis protein [Bacillota bacterium]
MTNKSLRKRIHRQVIAACGFNTYRAVILSGIASTKWPESRMTGKLRKEKQKRLLLFLEKDNKNIIQKYKNCPAEKEKNTGPVWIFWWQGEEKAPEVVKKCIANVRSFVKNRTVCVVDEKNYADFVNLPEIFLERLKRGEMSLTHLSDVMRFYLLRDFGGLWMDASMFLCREIPDFVWNAPFYSVRAEDKSNNEFVSGSRWVIGLMGGSKNNLLFRVMVDFFESYWTNNSCVIDYMMTDYALALAYRNIPAVREMVDKLPFQNTKIYVLGGVGNEEFDKAELERLSKDTFVFRFSWKNSYIEKLPGERLTWYGYFSHLEGAK